ncbi:hypothetical protein [Bacteroides cellulosilyticus]|jgi:hypothetical protein|uniref:Uncharacterized protein n=1 Tax=Bacteroides cellulosilyticus TaxID=246787 RepID=A0A5M6A512_9BACE|nr:hypothetical protein [Bacteroides cellulosilyticus]KAA5403155.1 hypothetical protein F2Y86_24695 [Bacteroides cellulosilyticus]RYU12196.1 hypothetical protein EAJ01_24735 [Bacteroides cellulosilyticus]
MVYGLFISAALLLFFTGFALYENKSFGSGALLGVGGMLPLYCVVCDFVREYCSFEAFPVLQSCITALFIVAAIALAAKAFNDNARHEEEEARRREEERKKPIVVNIKITSTTVEKN